MSNKEIDSKHIELKKLNNITAVCKDCVENRWQTTGFVVVEPGGLVSEGGISRECRKHHRETAMLRGHFGHNQFTLIFQNEEAGTLNVPSECCVGFIFNDVWDKIQSQLTTVKKKI